MAAVSNASKAKWRCLGANVTKRLTTVMSNTYELSGHPFPKPLPKTEAGETAVPWENQTQRRYLWTDSFAVVNMVTMYHRTEDKAWLAKAEKLVEAVESSLGQTRGKRASIKMVAVDQKRPFRKCKGLRIGKVDPKEDDGMGGDGMYYHYISKWLFALIRLGSTFEQVGAKEKANLYVGMARELAEDTHKSFVKKDMRGKPLGMSWKLHTNLESLSRGMMASDAVEAFVTYRLIQYYLKDQNVLKSEAEEMRQATVRSLSSLLGWCDTLGTGSNMWILQWIKGGLPAVSNTVLQKAVKYASRFCENGTGSLPFRDYGLILGVKTTEHEGIFVSNCDDVKPQLADYDANSCPHSSINAVMYVTAVDPYGFCRLHGEPQFDINDANVADVKADN